MNAVTRDPHAAFAAALLSPLLVFAALRFLADAGPSTAPAAPATIATSSEAGMEEPPPTPEVTRATAFLEAWNAGEPIPSPMRHPERADDPKTTEADPPSLPAEIAIPEFAVKSVMGSGERVMASINGKVYRMGDQPAPGWRITSMDAKSKRIEITGPDGRTIIVTPQTLAR